ncbi:nitrate- and nitrite sensing domain-containing protein [Longispora sp. NPDC051575]|uniref:sensor histidine kinase n=1 Tax=Longispora sp. NPDC051575 TaxID=3154943 RepID=UPI003442B078
MTPAPTAPLSRRRGALALLRDVRIRSKLALILTVPFLLIVALAAGQLLALGDQAGQAGQLTTLATVNRQVAGVIQQLQLERSAAAAALTGAGDDPSYLEQARRTDAEIAKYTALGPRRLPGLTEGAAALLRRVDDQVQGLGLLRQQVAPGRTVALSTAAFRYRTLIADLLSYRASLAQAGVRPDIADQIRAAVALSTAKEAVQQEQVVVLRALAFGRLDPAQQRDFVATTTGYSESLLAFSSASSPGQRALLDQTVQGADVLQAQRFEGAVTRTLPNTPLKLTGTATDWRRVMSARAELLRTVEDRVDGDVIGSLSAYRDDQTRQAVTSGSIVLVVLVLAVFVALGIARSMLVPLRQLREGALTVAYTSLPAAVARLRELDAHDATSHRRTAVVESPIDITGRDEIAQVGEAFNVVHQEAVRIAAEQAALRAGISRLFVNLARRSQLLVDRLIGQLDLLEQNEKDPDQLEALFGLDHLATRMRRNNENLLVLAGTEGGRTGARHTPLSDVVRAAQSEIERYTRVEVGATDAGVDLLPHAVNNVVHLLAELLDNATSFSAPDTTVLVQGRRVDDEVVVTIEDSGLGLEPDQLAELNTQLAHPPAIDTSVRLLGIIAVGRISTRLGITVVLRARPGGGTIAEVRLPRALFATGARHSRSGPDQVSRPRPPRAPVVPQWDVFSRGVASLRAAGRPVPDAVGAGLPVVGAEPVALLDLAGSEPVASLAREVEPVPEARVGHVAGLVPEAHLVHRVGPVPEARTAHQGEPVQTARSVDLVPEARPAHRQELAAEAEPAPAPLPPSGASPAGFDADATRELPIFRQVETAWFSRGSTPTVPTQRDTAWAAADPGWAAARAAAEPRPAEDTTAGLPRREPMAHLVPGRADAEAPDVPITRTADAMRASLAAFQLGAIRGRVSTEVPAPPAEEHRP